MVNNREANLVLILDKDTLDYIFSTGTQLYNARAHLCATNPPGILHL